MRPPRGVQNLYDGLVKQEGQTGHLMGACDWQGATQQAHRSTLLDNHRRSVVSYLGLWITGTIALGH